MRFRLLLIITLTAGLVLGAAGCSDDDDPVAATAKKYFAIQVNVDGSMSKALTLDIDFAMGLTDVLPEVTFNGVEIPAFGVEADILYGSLDLPYSDTVIWSVRQGDKVVSGTLTAPTEPTAVTCNGTTLSDGGTTYLTEAANYVFAWTGGDAHHYEGQYETYDGDNWSYNRYSTRSATITYPSVVGEQPREFSVRAVNGAELVPGAAPNATGWANGYVAWRMDNNWYNLGLGPIKSARPVDEAPLHQRLADFLY